MHLALRQYTENLIVPDDSDYLALVDDILSHPVFQSMKEYIQHGTTSCLEHCISVSYLSYLTCKKYDLDFKSAARAGLLHDFFLYDWHVAPPSEGLHGLVHPRIALKNAEKHFTLNEMEKEIILKHMWPLTFRLPKYPETYVVLYHDKVCSAKEAFKLPVLQKKDSPVA